MLCQREDGYKKSLSVSPLGSFKRTTRTHRVAVNYLLNLRKSAVDQMCLVVERFAEDLTNGLGLPASGETNRSILIVEVKVLCAFGMLHCLDRPHRAAYLLGEFMEFSGPESTEVFEILPWSLPLTSAACAIGDLSVHQIPLWSRFAPCRLPL